MTIKVLEICTLDKLREREKFWINELNTSFPYGLNDRIDEGGIRDSYIHMKTDGKKPIYTTFNKVVVTRGKRAGNNRKDEDFDPSTFIDDLFALDTDNFCWLSKKMINELKLRNVKKLCIHITNSMENNTTRRSRYTEYPYHILKDICMYRYYCKNQSKNTNKEFLILEYVNGLVDKFNFKSVLRKHKDLFPGSSAFDTPDVSFRYTKTIRSKIVNYKNPDNDAVCHCEEYPQGYVDEHHHHIMTGDLNIISNSNLRDLIGKGLNFREAQRPDKTKALHSYQGAIDEYIDRMSTRLSVPKKAFTPWKTALLKNVENKLNGLQSYSFNNILGKQENREYVCKLQEHFVFTPVDKAGNNVSIVCKKFYYDTLYNEIANSGNFELLDVNEQFLIDKVKKHLSDSKIDKFVSVKDKLPFLYWTSKMHKNPPNFRHITSGRDTVLSSLSEKVGLCLQALLKCDKANSKYLHKYHNYNDYFVVDNRDPVIEYMVLANGRNQPNKSVRTYDFTSLYTKIPHRKLKRNIEKFIRKVFMIKKKKYINVSNGRAYFAQKFSSKVLSLSCDDLIKHVNFIIDNSYIKFDDKCYRQIIGIPMGTNCAPHVANIFLHVFEYEFIDDLVIVENVVLASKLKTMFRYQDDLIVFEDKCVNGNAFSNNIHNIYPPEMELKSTNLAQNTCTYLDLRISIHQGKYNYRSYDKRNDFPFDVINYPYKNSNIPTNPAYGVFTSQLVRLGRINKTANYFQKDTVKLVKKFVNQGFDSMKLREKYLAYCTNYLSEWGRYGVDISSHEYVKKLFG